MVPAGFESTIVLAGQSLSAERVTNPPPDSRCQESSSLGLSIPTCETGPGAPFHTCPSSHPVEGNCSFLLCLCGAGSAHTMSSRQDSLVHTWKMGWWTREGSGPPRTVHKERGTNSPQSLLPHSGGSEDVRTETPVPGRVQGQAGEPTRVQSGSGSYLSGLKQHWPCIPKRSTPLNLVPSAPGLRYPGPRPANMATRKDTLLPRTQETRMPGLVGQPLRNLI